jgi:hypothetical protein
MGNEYLFQIRNQNKHRKNRTVEPKKGSQSIDLSQLRNKQTYHMKKMSNPYYSSPKGRVGNL